MLAEVSDPATEYVPPQADRATEGLLAGGLVLAGFIAAKGLWTESNKAGLSASQKLILRGQAVIAAVGSLAGAAWTVKTSEQIFKESAKPGQTYNSPLATIADKVASLYATSAATATDQARRAADFVRSRTASPSTPPETEESLAQTQPSSSTPHSPDSPKSPPPDVQYRQGVDDIEQVNIDPISSSLDHFQPLTPIRLSPAQIEASLAATQPMRPVSRDAAEVSSSIPTPPAPASPQPPVAQPRETQPPTTPPAQAESAPVPTIIPLSENLQRAQEQLEKTGSYAFETDAQGVAELIRHGITALTPDLEQAGTRISNLNDLVVEILPERAAVSGTIQGAKKTFGVWIPGKQNFNASFANDLSRRGLPKGLVVTECKPDQLSKHIGGEAVNGFLTAGVNSQIKVDSARFSITKQQTLKVELQRTPPPKHSS